MQQWRVKVLQSDRPECISCVTVGHLLTLSDPCHLCNDNETTPMLQGFLALTLASFITGAH